MSFNPFDKPIGTPPTADDLNSLIGRVAEGYFVEYKGEFPQPKKIAHSIASLANTFGGWYFVGIKTDDNHLASDVCGFQSADVPDPVAKVRDVVKTRIDPVPVFYAWPVDLDGIRSAIAVFVPGGQRTPYITDDGRVYRRNHDSSDPVPETSRHTLDHLSEMGRGADDAFERLCSREFEPEHLLDRDDPTFWLNLYIMPEPLGLISRFDLLDEESVDSLLQLSREARSFREKDILPETAANLPFNYAQIESASVSLRQVSTGETTRDSLSVELRVSGSARIHIPLYCRGATEVWSELEDQQSAAAFVLEEFLEEGFTSRDSRVLRFFDVDDLVMSLVTLTNFYLDWLGDMPWLPDFKIGYSIRAPVGATPFQSSEAWASLVRKWGFPVLRQDVQAPDPWKFAPVYRPRPGHSLWLPVLRNLLPGIGLPRDMTGSVVARALTRQR